MNSEQRENRRKDRRKGSDWLVRVLALLNLAAWCLLITALAMGHFAKPEFNSALVKYWGLPVKSQWNYELVRHLELLLYACIASTTLTLVLHRLRNRRRSDSFRTNLVFLLLISAASLFAFSTI